MKVTHTSAVIGFCWDLTDSEAESLPVAVLVVGSADGLAFAAVSSVVPASPDGLDPISYDVLSDVPGLIKDHVMAAMRSLPDDTPVETLLTTLHARLRNSLHVASIGEQQSEDLDVDELRSEEIPDAIAQRLLDKARAVHHELLVQAGFSAAAPARPLGHAMPSMSVWPLPTAKPSLHVHP